MQTFLPYSNFDRSASVLDPSRLGNQAYRECKVLITGGWPNHPASKMWDGYKPALALYALACFKELDRRGKNYQIHKDFFKRFIPVGERILLPPWLGNESFHSAHRAILLAKNYEWYSQFGWTEEPAEKVNNRWPYVWPV